MCVVKQANEVAGFHHVEKGNHDWQDILAKDNTDTIKESGDDC